MTTWTDETGRSLTVEPADGDNPARLVTEAQGVTASFWVTGSAREEVGAAILAACGLPAPVVLERPEIDPAVSASDGDFRVWLSDGVVVSLGGACIERSADRALGMAALLAAYALALKARKAEPPAAEVDALAMVLVEGRDAMGLDGARPLARRILAAGYRRGEGNG